MVIVQTPSQLFKPSSGDRCGKSIYALDDDSLHGYSHRHESSAVVSAEFPDFAGSLLDHHDASLSRGSGLILSGRISKILILHLLYTQAVTSDI
jgi:hypothetical protein